MNSTTLGVLIYESQIAVDEALKTNGYGPVQVPVLWRDQSEAVCMAYIDIAQRVLDELAQSGVIS